jgi:hypothetical protein
MFNTRWVAFKMKRRFDDDGCCASDEPEIKRIAYELWEKADRPDGMSDHFWKEAKKQVADQHSKPPIRETNYVCECCGQPAYFDGRCGDGPILMCNCPRNSRPIPSSEYRHDWFW